MYRIILPCLAIVAFWANISSAITLRRDEILDERNNDGLTHNNARLSFYDASIGACGVLLSNTAFTVALNQAQYGSGAHCFEVIEITAEGKTTQAQILDDCPGCPLNGLDLTPALFEFFAPLEDGVITGSWFSVNGTA